MPVVCGGAGDDPNPTEQGSGASLSLFPTHMRTPSWCFVGWRWGRVCTPVSSVSGDEAASIFPCTDSEPPAHRGLVETPVVRGPGLLGAPWQLLGNPRPFLLQFLPSLIPSRGRSNWKKVSCCLLSPSLPRAICPQHSDNFTARRWWRFV